MDDQDKVIRFPDANRPKVEQGETPANPGNPGKHEDGGHGTSGTVESMAQEQTQEVPEEDQKLFIEQEAGKFRDYCLQLFGNLAHQKYDKGQKEHGGLIYERVTFDDQFEELIDAMFYLIALQSKIVNIFGDQPEKLNFLFKHKSEDVAPIINGCKDNDDLEPNNS
tara:strand:+ start:290 stop:787 length:498 start_codon:yes stop_codon:yes gene_type:complete